MATFTNPTKVVTGNVVFSYLNCWDPKAAQPGATPKYSVSLLIKKSDTKTVDKINAAIQAAYEEGQSKLKGNSKSVPALNLIKTPKNYRDRLLSTNNVLPKYSLFRKTTSWHYFQ